MLPLNILKQLKCADCRRYLSYQPTKILPNGKGICGRCETKSLGITSETFDFVASTFSYPCRYRENYCPSILPRSEIVLHEELCSFKPGCCLGFRQLRASTPKGLEKEETTKINAIEILHGLQCSKCHKNPTIYPIFITSEGQDVCYECGHSAEPALTRNNPLETILKAFSFAWEYGPHPLYEDTKKGEMKKKVQGKKHKVKRPHIESSSSSDSGSSSSEPIDYGLHSWKSSSPVPSRKSTPSPDYPSPEDVSSSSDSPPSSRSPSPNPSPSPSPDYDD